MEEANVEVRETTRDNRGERRGDCLQKFELDVLAHRAHTHRQHHSPSVPLHKVFPSSGTVNSEGNAPICTIRLS